MRIKYEIIIARLLFFSTLIWVIFFSLIPKPPQVFSFDNSDKVEHIIAYCSLSILFILSFYSRISTEIKRIAFSIIFCAVLGAGIEILQGFTGRSPDIFDWFADMAGSAIGVAMLKLTISIIKT